MNSSRMIGVIVRNTILMLVLIFITYTLLEQNSETFVANKQQPATEADELYNFVFSNPKSTTPEVTPQSSTMIPTQMPLFRPYDTLDSMYAKVV